MDEIHYNRPGGIKVLSDFWKDLFCFLTGRPHYEALPPEVEALELIGPPNARQMDNPRRFIVVTTEVRNIRKATNLPAIADVHPILCGWKCVRCEIHWLGGKYYQASYWYDPSEGIH